MKENIGEADRKSRIIIGVTLFFIGAAGYIGLIPVANILPQALTSIILVVISLILIITGLMSKCIIYRILGIETT